MDRTHMGFAIGKGDVVEAASWNGVARQVSRHQAWLKPRSIKELLQNSPSVMGALTVARDDDGGLISDGLQKVDEGPAYV